MILGRDIHPERNLYFWGAKILALFDPDDFQGVSCVELFERLRATCEISFELFVLALDWLFLLEAIDGRDGMLKKCS